MAGGDEQSFKAGEQILACMGRKIVHCGGAGAGQAAKAVNQIIISGTYASVGEGLAYAERAGLPLEALVEALPDGRLATIPGTHMGCVARSELGEALATFLSAP